MPPGSGAFQMQTCPAAELAAALAAAVSTLRGGGGGRPSSETL